MNLPLNPFRFLAPRAVAALAATVLGCAMFPSARAEEPAKASAPTSEQEAKFIATLTNATLKGRSCGLQDGQLGPDREDSYSIVSVKKLDGDKWQINARMSHGGKDIDVPIPAQVKWAGDAPVLVLDNVSMGGSQTYSARVMIYEKTYSGWWSGGDHGGLLNGIITNGKN